MRADEIASRVRFDLTYRRERERREFDQGGLSGLRIPNAYKRGGWQDGMWCAAFPEWEDDSVDWLREFFSVAIMEAVHEALEWFRVDGKPLVDPHARHEAKVLDLTAALAHALYALGAPPSVEQEADNRPDGRRLCAHADRDGEGAHWLTAGEVCEDAS